MLLRVGQCILGNLLKENGATRADLRHLDSHPGVGLPALIKGDGIGAATNFLPVTLAFDVIENPPDAASSRIFVHTFDIFWLFDLRVCHRFCLANSRKYYDTEGG